MTTSRTQFEAWYQKHFNHSQYLEWNDKGFYESPATGNLFAAWRDSQVGLTAENERLSCRLGVSEDTRQVIRKCLATAEGEIDQLKAEVEALRGVMAAVVSEIPHARYVSPGNSPDHSHRRPGIWDEDNGAKAGKECGWCKVWNTAIAMSKEAGHD